MAPTAVDAPTMTSLSSKNPSDPIPSLRNALNSENTPLAVRFRALFSLKHYASLQPPEDTTLPAIHAIAAAFSTPSALLKHELAYCLGQSKNNAVIPYLTDVLSDRKEDSMCRHEAAEALGAVGHLSSVPILKQFCNPQEVAVVRETCEIAINRIEWAHSSMPAEIIQSSDFTSVDPAPSLAHNEGLDWAIPDLQRHLLDTRRPLFDRYRVMFALRDLASPPSRPTATAAVEALASGFTDQSALFRHEIAFVFGQLSHPASIPSLIEVLQDKNEEGMVRHEAAEALGSLGDQPGVDEVLRQCLDDEEKVVRDSVIVALDMASFEQSGEKDYTVLPDTHCDAYSTKAGISLAA